MPNIPLSHERLPDRPSLAQLRSQARDLQRAVRRGDSGAAALAPDPVGSPEAYPLHLAQLAVARRYGYASWALLAERVRLGARLTRDLTPNDPTSDLLERFLRDAVLTYAADDEVRRAAAAELARAHPELASRSIQTAAALADPEAIAAHLTREPGAAGREGGPFRWEPLLSLAYSRVAPASEEAAVRSLRLLLDAEADPNAGFLWAGLATPFTALTGLMGGGEQGSERLPAHPHWEALARTLLDAGADANDGQALYNRMFEPDDSHLRLLFDYGLGTGDGGPWHRRIPETDSPAGLLQGQLAWAVTHGLTDRIRLLVAHDVPLDEPLDGTSLPQATSATALDLALLSGRTDSAHVLRELGAGTGPAGAEAEMVGALLTGDPATVMRLERTEPGLLTRVRTQRPSLVLRAVANGSTKGLELLLDNGFDIDAMGRADVVREERWETALHHAAGQDDVAMVRLLLAAGADPQVRDRRFDATPLDWARHLGSAKAASVLAGLTTI